MNIVLSKQILFIMLGAGLGGTLRFLTSMLLAQRFGTGYPYGTLTVNMIGCFLIGLISTYLNDRYTGSPVYWTMFLIVGLLGGLTTFSSFSYEVVTMMRHGNLWGAFTHIFFNTFGGFFATWLGIFIVRLTDLLD